VREISIDFIAVIATAAKMTLGHVCQGGGSWSAARGGHWSGRLRRKSGCGADDRLAAPVDGNRALRAASSR
jgi:hypothetical protein